MGNKSIWFDLDGTLLNSQGQISQESVKVFDILREREFKIGIATGRPIFMIKQEIELLKPDLPIITINGCLVSSANLDNQKYQNIFCQSLDSNEARNIYHYLVNNENDFLIYTDQEAFYYDSSKKCQRIKEIKNILANLPTKYRYGFYNLAKLDFEPNHHKILKFLVFTNYYNNNQLIVLKKFLRQFKESYFINSQANFLDIINIKASKGKALKSVGGKYDLDLSKSFAFGDSENDLSMFESVGFSVAMLNAPLKIQEQAWAITSEDNNHGGVNKFLKNKVINESSYS